ncbi:DUF5017 domain-containing protein [Aestuariivivens sediminis]|uniref:DUF5017 domain-containing protein n=1 Tax=Aestuariivivens sediminis TaxID=2913557 RepID=UPI001F589426|nr:DUF5017 domain-containing protein [Aestuariivivens sediminis]
MKLRIKFLLIFLTTSIFISCSDDLETPEVDFTVDNSSPVVGETVKFTITGGAETFVIFTGDENHEFEKSHLAITSGVDVDQELVVLRSEALPDIRDFLEPSVNTHNANAGPGNQLNLDAIMTNMATQVGIEYTNKLTAAYIIWEYFTELQGQVARDIVDAYYEDNSTLLAPEGGFSTGVAIDRYEKTLEYSYANPGMYVVTLIATNLSDKQYSGSGYQDDRTSSGDEYDLSRNIKELVITVTEP